MMLETALGYKSSWRILELLSETPTKPVSRTDIKNYTQLGNEAVNSALRRLTLVNMLVKERRGKKETYYLDLSNEFSKSLLGLLRAERAHLKNISFDTLLILSEFTRRLLEKTAFAGRLFLFGSVAKGTARVNSDIDIALVVSKKDAAQELTVTQIIDSLSMQFKRKVQAHYFTEDEFVSSKSPLLEDIRNDGIELIGSLNSRKR